MNILEIQAVYVHIGSKCSKRGIHSTLSIVDCKEVNLLLWKMTKKGTQKIVMEKSVPINDDGAIRGLMLDINEALHEKNTVDIFS